MAHKAVPNTFRLRKIQMENSKKRTCFMVLGSYSLPKQAEEDQQDAVREPLKAHQQKYRIGEPSMIRT